MSNKSSQNVIISEDDFVDIWGAHASDTGDLFEYEAVKDLPLNTVWTVVEGDNDDWIAIPGFHIVNKLGYVLTEKPWDDTIQEAMWFEALHEDDEDEESED